MYHLAEKNSINSICIWVFPCIFGRSTSYKEGSFFHCRWETRDLWSVIQIILGDNYTEIRQHKGPLIKYRQF